MKARILTVLIVILATAAPAQRFVKTFNTIAEMVATNPNDANTNAFVAGYRSVNDGGGGMFTYSKTSGAATNLGTVFKSGHSLAPAAGRWIREFSGALNVRWFGAVGDFSADDTTAITNAVATASTGQTVYFPPGTYKVTKTIVLPNRATIAGESTSSSLIYFRPVTASFLFDLGTNRDNVTFQDLYLNNAVESSGVGRVGAIIQTPTGAPITELIIDRVDFEAFTKEAISIPEALYVMISNCRFLSIADISTSGGEATNSAVAIKLPTSNVIHIYKCRFSINDRDIVIDVCNEADISDCSFERSGGHPRSGFTSDYFIDIGSSAAKALSFRNNYVEDERTSTNKSVLRIRNSYSPQINANLWEGMAFGIRRTHNFVELSNCVNAVISGNSFSETLQNFITTLDTNQVSAWNNSFYQNFALLTSKAQIEPYLTTNLVELTGDFINRNVRVLGSNDVLVNFQSAGLNNDVELDMRTQRGAVSLLLNDDGKYYLWNKVTNSTTVLRVTDAAGVSTDGITLNVTNAVFNVPLRVQSMTKAARDALASPQNGWIIYQTDGASPGFHGYEEGAWVKFNVTADP